MKNIILSLLLAVTSVSAADSFYRDREFQIDSFYQTVTPDFEAESGSAGVGLNAFLTRNFGLGVSTDLANMNGHFIDNVAVRGIWRVPIDRTALYAYGGGTRYLKAEEWAINLGGGAEYRFTQNFGPYGEVGMIKLLKHGAEATARVGLRFSF